MLNVTSGQHLDTVAHPLCAASTIEGRNVKEVDALLVRILNGLQRQLLIRGLRTQPLSSDMRQSDHAGQMSGEQSDPHPVRMAERTATDTCERVHNQFTNDG